MAMAIFSLEPVEPIHPEPRAFVARLGGPERHILLRCQIFRAAIGAVIVHDQEMRNPQLAVVAQEIRQADMLVAHGREQQNIARLDLMGPIDHRIERKMLAKRANLGPFASQPHPI